MDFKKISREGMPRQTLEPARLEVVLMMNILTILKMSDQPGWPTTSCNCMTITFDTFVLPFAFTYLRLPLWASLYFNNPIWSVMTIQVL